LPDGVSVEIERGTWPELPVFRLMQRLGNVEEMEMFRTFNMGIGMIVVCSAGDVSAIRENVGTCYEIGRVVEGDKRVSIV
jgi:phosphoribosylformylglycinamidine cyclo-ligase